MNEISIQAERYGCCYTSYLIGRLRVELARKFRSVQEWDTVVGGFAEDVLSCLLHNTKPDTIVLPIRVPCPWLYPSD